MYKNTKRAERRHHYARLKNKRLRKGYWDGLGALKGVHLGIAANTPCICSCEGCGNPRRHHGELTLAERRHLDSFADQLKESFDHD